MFGSYDLSLVLMSYVIATLASFTALELASRVALAERGRIAWLIGGSIAMGTGIWSMHFVGMAAFSLPVPITYDLALTVYSWLAAIIVSALALWTIARSRLTSRTILIAAILMGVGICVMHYTGMYAMRMQPPIRYDPILFASSALIAVLASAAALIIAFQLRVIASWRDVVKRVGAAFIMGFAIVGMHYTGMAASEFAPGSFCAPENQLTGNWVGGPMLVIGLLILPLTLSMTFGIANARLLAQQEADKLQLRQWAASHVHIDDETHLANRSGLIQALMAAIRKRDRFALVGVRLTATRIDDGKVLTDLHALMPRIVARLRTVYSADSELARLSVCHFVGLIHQADQRRIELDIMPRIARAFREPILLDDRFAHRIDIECGLGLYPDDGSSAQQLLVRASRHMRRVPRSAEPEAHRVSGSAALPA